MLLGAVALQCAAGASAVTEHEAAFKFYKQRTPRCAPFFSTGGVTWRPEITKGTRLSCLPKARMLCGQGSAGSRPLVPALFAYGCSSSERTGSQTVSKTPEQREQVRAAQVAHPAASTSAHDPPRPRPCVWPCEVVWRRAWSSKANKRKAHEAPWRPRRVHGYR